MSFLKNHYDIMMSWCQGEMWEIMSQEKSVGQQPIRVEGAVPGDTRDSCFWGTIQRELTVRMTAFPLTKETGMTCRKRDMIDRA